MQRGLRTRVKRRGVLERLGMVGLGAVVARLRWLKSARGAQLTPKGDWRIWLILAGRGWGKTRTGAEDVAFYALWNPGVRVGVVAATFADARDVCVEGESGILKALPPRAVMAWHRSTGDILLRNGSRIKLFSADQPDRLRGPQHHRVWCDEVAAWGSREAFDQMMFGLRLGSDPRVVITTTPRNVEIVRELVARAGRDVFLTRGATKENAAHLAPCVLAQLNERYAGTRLGRQELDAELLDDTDGALWTREMIEGTRVSVMPDMQRVVVAVDPAMTSNGASDETGIVAAGLGVDGFVYVVADASGKYTPEAWARRALAVFESVGADALVAEVNAGGDLVERVLRQVDPFVPYRGVRAVKGKMERAYPVAALYEQGRVRHVGRFWGLEEQMLRFAPDVVAAKSPDRVDALVWAVTALMEGGRAVPRVVRL